MSAPSPEPADAGTSRLPSTAEVDGLTVADVMHAGSSGLAPEITVRELNEWFAVSVSRRLAILAAGGRYAGALVPGDIPPGARDDQPALELAHARPTLAPDAPAATGRDVVFATAERRVPVVDAGGRLHGVLAVTTDLRHFACRPAPAATSDAPVDPAARLDGAPGSQALDREEALAMRGSGWDPKRGRS